MQRTKLKRGGIGLLAAVAAFGLSLTLGSPAQAVSQYDLDCTSCHTMPPTDARSAEKDPDDGSIPGNHQQHAGSSKDSCVVCHGSLVTGYAIGHRNKAIELSDGLQYGRKVNGFLNQTSVPPNPLSGCATAACHSNGIGKTRSTSTYRPTPAWGSAPLAKDQQSSCVTCHDIAPNSGNHPSLSGAGKKHGDYFGTGTGSCGKCHSDHFAEAAPFAHATSAGKRSVEVKFAAGGGFDGANCSNVYCHSNGKGAFQTPTWGGTLDCSGCHGTASSNTLSGKHASHVNNAALLGSNYGCVECHASTVSSDSSIATLSKHTNGSVDFGGPRVGTPASGTCSATYCHSDGKGNNKSVTWSQSQTLDCKGCHGSDSTPGSFVGIAGEPNYPNSGADQTLANTHQKHVKSAADCQNCHSQTTDNGTRIISGGKHTDGSIETVAGNGKGFDITNKTCSNITCHGGNGIIASVPAAKWGASLGCSGCHGDAGTLASNAHQKHVTTMGYGCATCHADTVTDNTTLKAGAPHANNTVNVIGSSVSFTKADMTCATACHGSNRPTWTNSATGACGTCHSALSTTTNGLIALNAHGAHYGAAYGPKFDGTSANSCAVCHVYTGETAATHANGSVNLNGGFAKAGTCSTCHKQTTDWTATGRLACESCHTGALSVINGKTAPDKSLAATKGHGAAGQQCAACHDNTTQHIGVAGGTTRLKAALTGSSNQECVYCHSDAAKVTTVAKQITNVHGGFANKCSACHDPHGTTNSNMIYTNMSTTAGRNSGISYSGTTSFITADGKGICQVCHTQTSYFRRGVAVDATSHQQVGANCLDCHKHNPGAGKTAFTPDGACNACHGYPPVPRNLGLVAGVNFGKQGLYTSARFEDYSGGGGAHISLAHLDANITPDMQFAPCLKCHSGADAYHQKSLPVRTHIANVTVKVDPQYRFSTKRPFMGYTGANLVDGANKTGSCYNVSCHFKRSKQWSSEK
jgi:predicted CxxxxCH...CXXCH cytochrome family protein